MSGGLTSAEELGSFLAGRGMTISEGAHKLTASTAARPVEMIGISLRSDSATGQSVETLLCRLPEGNRSITVFYDKEWLAKQNVQNVLETGIVSAFLDKKLN
jgi:hypothetical protein